MQKLENFFSQSSWHLQSITDILRYAYYIWVQRKCTRHYCELFGNMVLCLFCGHAFIFIPSLWLFFIFCLDFKIFFIFSSFLKGDVCIVWWSVTTELQLSSKLLVLKKFRKQQKFSVTQVIFLQSCTINVKIFHYAFQEFLSSLTNAKNQEQGSHAFWSKCTSLYYAMQLAVRSKNWNATASNKNSLLSNEPITSNCSQIDAEKQNALSIRTGRRIPHTSISEDVKQFSKSK